MDVLEMAYARKKAVSESAAYATGAQEAAETAKAYADAMPKYYFAPDADGNLAMYYAGDETE